MDTISHLYRQILADNADDSSRVLEINKKLDAITINKKYVLQAMRASSLSRVAPVRMMLREYYFRMGDWPSEATIKQNIEEMRFDLEVIKYIKNDAIIELVINDAGYDNEVVVVGDEAGRVIVK